MRYIIILLLATISISTNAQLSFGPKAGINIVKIKFTSGNFETKSMLRYHIGAFANYSVSSAFAVQAELFYSAEGTKEKSTVNTNNGQIDKGYIHLPVLAQYKLAKGLLVEAGPQIGLLLSSKEKYAGRTSDIKENYYATDLRVPVGVGYTFPESICKGLAVDLRYSFSLSKINKVAVGGGDLKNQVISLGALYTLSRKKK